MFLWHAFVLEQNYQLPITVTGAYFPILMPRLVVAQLSFAFARRDRAAEPMRYGLKIRAMRPR
jgi:hypothetical protein